MDEVDGEVTLIDPPDEERHYKVIFIARRAMQESQRRS
jgi:hypothetical protein